MQQRMTLRRIAAGVCGLFSLVSNPAHAFDPWEGATPPQPATTIPASAPAATARPLHIFPAIAYDAPIPAPTVPTPPVAVAAAEVPPPIQTLILPEAPAMARATPPAPPPVAAYIAPAPRLSDDTLMLADAAPIAAAEIPPPIQTLILPDVPATATAAPVTTATPSVIAPPPIASYATATPAWEDAPILVAEAPSIAEATLPTAPIMLAEAKAPEDTTADGRHRFAVGVEGFHDRYEESVANLDNSAIYGSLTGDYTYYVTPNWVAGLGARASYGRNQYRSNSGKVGGIPQWEFDGRITLGYEEHLGNGHHLMPYVGLAARYFRDQGKGYRTDLGFSLYDRDILQIYSPFGVTYRFPAWGYQFAPTIEYGSLLYARVNSHIGQVPGYYDITNAQHSGYELRADMLISDLDNAGRGLAFGPFLRYWYFDNSDIATTPSTPSGTQWAEPENSRLQLGVQVKYLF